MPLTSSGCCATAQVATTGTEMVLLLLLVLLLLVGLPTSAATRQTCPQVRGFMAAGRTVRLLVLVPHFLTLLRHGCSR